MSRVLSVCFCCLTRSLPRNASESFPPSRRSTLDMFDGVCISVVFRESEFKSEDPGFDPLAGQGEEPVFYPSKSINSCADLFVPDPPLVCMAHTQICAHVKDPISICHNRLGLTAGSVETRKHCTHEKKKMLGSAILWLLVFPGESSSNVP